MLEPDRQTSQGSGAAEGPLSDLLSQEALDSLLASASASGSPLLDNSPVNDSGDPLQDGTVMDPMAAADLESEGELLSASSSSLARTGHEVPYSQGLDTGDAQSLALDQQSVDDLMAELEKAHTLPAAPPPAIAAAVVLEAASPKPTSSVIVPPPAPSAEEDLSSDLLDAIIAAASTEEAVVSENLAAAAMTPSPDYESLTQNDLDHIIEKAKELGLEIKELQTTADAAAPRVKVRKNRVRTPSPDKGAFFSGLKAHLPRLGASLLFGLVAGTGTWLFLKSNSAVPDTPPAAGTAQINDLAEATAEAQRALSQNQYAKALEVLEPHLAEAPDGPGKLEAQYTQMEARVKGFVFEEASPEYMKLHEDLLELVKRDPDHPRAPEALQWKSDLFELDDLDSAALQTYTHLIEQYPNYPRRDAALRNAARLAIDNKRATTGAEFAQQLLQEYPGSQYAEEARLMVAETYQMLGNVSDAQVIYVRTAEEAGNTPLGNQALFKLGNLYFEHKDFDAAIHVLEELLATTTTTEKNDEAYLLLAKAYRGKGRYPDAAKTLNDLISFLPESDVTPLAHVELSQITDLSGDRPGALRLAEQAAVRFPENPDVLKNKGLMLGLMGNAYGAGTALLAADEAGARDPELLLTATRHFSTAGQSELAEEAYTRLRENYPGTPQAIEGGIENALLLFKTSQPSAAVDRLEELSLSTVNTPRHVDVLLAMTDIYESLGLDERVGELARQIDDETDGIEALAQTTLVLFRAGRVDDALAMLNKVDTTKLDGATQYTLQMAAGHALLKLDPGRGLDKMEKTYYGFPALRTPEDEQLLLDAYLRADRTAGARRLISEMEARVQALPVQAPLLVDAALKWGDHLYEKQDYSGASEAYDLAFKTATQSTPPIAGATRDYRWGLFQRANSLLAQSNFEDSIVLFDEVSTSDAPWAEDARAKANFARLEQRRRGFPVPPPPVKKG